MQAIQEAARKIISGRESLAKWCLNGSHGLVESFMMDAATIRATARLLLSSQVIIWQAEMWELASNGFESFKGLAPQDVNYPTEPQLWYLDGFGLNLASVGGELAASLPVGVSNVGAILVIPPNSTGDHRAVAMCVMEFESKPLLRACNLHDMSTRTSASIMACYAFTQLQIAAKEPVHLPRADRRRLEREDKTIPDIRVIQLRKREPSGWHSTGDRSYHHRWITRGTWRRLPEPLKRDSKISGGQKGDKVVWVREHIKGPSDAPLIQPKESVFVVAR